MEKAIQFIEKPIRYGRLPTPRHNHRTILDFVTSFVRIKDPSLKAFVAQHIESESLWPEPLIQLNPAFQNGGWIDELVTEGLLHKECSKVFRV